MIEAEAGDSRDQWLLDHIGRVEPPAEPDLKEAGIRRSARKSEEGDEGGDFKEAWFEPAARIEDLRQQGRQGLILDQLSSNTDPLVETHEVRAGEDMDGEAGGFEGGTQEGERRSFAIRPGDVEHGRKAVLRPAEALEHGADPIEAEPVAGRRKH